MVLTSNFNKWRLSTCEASKASCAHMMPPFFQQHSLLQETPVLEACKNGEPCDKLYTDHHLLKSFGIKLMSKWTALVWSEWIWRSGLHCSNSSLQELGICWSTSVHALISGESSFAHVQTWLMMGKTFMVLRDQLPPELHFLHSSISKWWCVVELLLRRYYCITLRNFTPV